MNLPAPLANPHTQQQPPVNQGSQFSFVSSVPSLQNRASNRPVLDETPTGKVPVQIANASPPSE